MPILAAYDDWWLASPRFRYFQAPPAADDEMPRHSVPRLGLRFAGTLMHRALPAAAITDGYAISSEPRRATVTWRTLGLQQTQEAALVQAAQHFRSHLRAEEGPVDTDILIADFLFMLLQRAGELAYHGDFAMGGRRSAPAERTEDLDGGAIWIFGGGPADTLETVVAHPDGSVPTTARLVGWPDGSIHMIDTDGHVYDVSGDPGLLTMLITEVHRKRREDVAAAPLEGTFPAVGLHNSEDEQVEIAAIHRRMVGNAGGALEPAAVCRLLGGISPAALEERRTRLDLLGVPQEGRCIYPLCQFHEGAILPHLAEVLRAFQGASPWTMLSVLLAPTNALSGATPISELRAGRYDDVVGVAAAWGTTGGA